MKISQDENKKSQCPFYQQKSIDLLFGPNSIRIEPSETFSTFNYSDFLACHSLHESEESTLAKTIPVQDPQPQPLLQLLQDQPNIELQQCGDALSQEDQPKRKCKHNAENFQRSVFKVFFKHLQKLIRRSKAAEFIEGYRGRRKSDGLGNGFVEIVIVLCWVQWNKPGRFGEFLQLFLQANIQKQLRQKAQFQYQERPEHKACFQKYIDKFMECLRIEKPGCRRWLQLFFENVLCRRRPYIQKIASKINPDFEQWILLQLIKK